jgi:DNA-binding MarR family transcriptional regulator
MIRTERPVPPPVLLGADRRSPPQGQSREITQPMQDHYPVLQDFLGSAHIFASAIDRLMEAQLQAVSNDGLSFSQLRLLKLVSITDSYTISDVASFLSVSNAAASKAVDRLVRRGLLERREGAQDRRVVELCLTEAGRCLLERFEARTMAALNDIFEPFDTEQLLDATTMLDNFSLAIVGHEENAGETPCFRCGIYFRDRCLLRDRGQPGCYFDSHKRRKTGEVDRRG